jgi:hypothetical protein
MNTVHVLIDGQPHDVELSRINLMYHDGNRKIEIRDPNVLEITPERTLGFARSVLRNEWDDLVAFDEAQRLYQLVWHNPIPATFEECNTAQLHVIGLIVLMTGAIVMGKTPFLRQPESYLHPAQQLGLADLLIELSKV